MLLHRIVTASILAAVVIWLILFQPSSVLAYLLYVISFISAYEWARLASIQAPILRTIFAFFVTLSVWFFINHYIEFALIYAVISSLWWFMVFIKLLNYKSVVVSNDINAGKLAIALLVIPAAAISIYSIHKTAGGHAWLLYSLMLVWVADIGAYFTGKRFGRIKLAPAVSPGKTREGLYGAILATSLYSVLAGFYFDLDSTRLILLLFLSFVLTVLSVVGDLYESTLKREVGVKDSGTILPGHGGMLDRIDSILAAVPLFYVGYFWLIETIEIVR